MLVCEVMHDCRLCSYSSLIVSHRSQADDRDAPQPAMRRQPVLTAQDIGIIDRSLEMVAVDH